MTFTLLTEQWYMTFTLLTEQWYMTFTLRTEQWYFDDRSKRVQCCRGTGSAANGRNSRTKSYNRRVPDQITVATMVGREYGGGKERRTPA